MLSQGRDVSVIHEHKGYNGKKLLRYGGFKSRDVSPLFHVSDEDNADSEPEAWSGTIALASALEGCELLSAEVRGRGAEPRA